MDEYVGAEPMETNGDDFSLMVDPVTGRVALVCPAPTVAFEDVDHFTDWANHLLEVAKQIKAVAVTGQSEPGGSIGSDYAAKVIAAWQEQISDSLGPSRTGDGAPTFVEEDDPFDKKAD